MPSKPADRGRRSAGAGAGAARECQGPASPGIVGRRGVLERFSRRTALRQKTDFLKRIKLIWPVQSGLQKYFASPPAQIKSISPAVLSLRGALAIVTNVGTGCGGRGCALDEWRWRGRRSRGVLTPRRWRQVGGSNSAGDGGKQARSPGRARNKPLKPLRAGMPGEPVYPW